MSNEELVRAIKSGQGVTEHMEILYIQNIGLINQIVKPFAKRMVHAEYEDLLQEAYFGLVQAIASFDESMGFKFMTYAEHHVKQRVRRYLHQIEHSIDIPEYVINDVYAYKKAVDEYIRKYKKEPSDICIAKLLGWQMSNLNNAKQAVKALQAESLNEMVGDNYDIEKIDTVVDEEQQYIWSDLEDKIDYGIVRSIVNELPDPDRKVIIMQFWHKKTLQQIAEELNITRYNAQNIRRNAIRDLRNNPILRAYENNYTPKKDKKYMERRNNYFDSVEGTVVNRLYEQWLEELIERRAQEREQVPPEYGTVEN